MKDNEIIKALLLTVGAFAGAILLAFLPVLFGEIGGIITLAIIFVGVFIAMKELVK